jgi:hypothetical protein
MFGKVLDVSTLAILLAFDLIAKEPLDSNTTRYLRFPSSGSAKDAPTVFISYAHDSSAHNSAVLALATLLTNNGIHVEFDRWASVERRDWGAWAIGHITGSDFVIMVASLDYRRIGDGLTATLDNRGAQAETAIIRDLLHSDRAHWMRRLLPVVLPGHEVDEIPMFLQPYCADHYRVTELVDGGITDLLRAITGQPGCVRPERGAFPTLPPEPC